MLNVGGAEVGDWVLPGGVTCRREEGQGQGHL